MPETTQVDEVIDRATIDLDNATIQRLCYDLAQRIHEPATIARRYGLVDEGGLRRWLGAHPQVVVHTKKMKALLDSDMGTEERTRLKALYATEDLIIPMAVLAQDPNVTATQRIDAFKQLNRVAGVDGPGAAGKNDVPGASGPSLVVNFHFSGGRTETLSTTVVENEVIQAHEALYGPTEP